MRIDKFLSNLKYGSRSNIGTDIKKGLVKINDKIITDSHFKVNPLKDKVFYNNILVPYFKNLNLMIYKPVGYLSANTDNLHEVVVSLIKDPFDKYDLKIAGRLDLDSEGLLILTNIGSFAHKITSPNSKIAKIYEVKTDNTNLNYEKMLDGVIIKDKDNVDFLAKSLKIIKIGDNLFEITIDEGKFHQVKRMFKALEMNVINLKRIQIGKLKLGDLKPGEYRMFDEDELL
ncbi:pseudouridine synthase [Haploplasma modicum]|uniref:pseudouridine synthase n=1 Tax=Haploplasma modicum TaxID=2150 RepID=UPI00214CAD66|nr:pseudouridine synthase [Haploplasma modicum]MCR1809400.1 pseudouridine synthase [Haploplasma modicum]